LQPKMKSGLLMSRYIGFTYS